MNALRTSLQGLTSEEAAARLQHHGLNRLPENKRVTFIAVVIHQFMSPLIYVLVVAGIVSLFINEYEDAIFIFLIITINAILGTYQEWKAESSAAALQQLVKSKARTLRDHEVVILEAEYLVPGDVVLVESGQRVQADMRLITCIHLRADESMLTGESMPVSKNTHELQQENLNLGDQVNMLFAGTTIMSGRGKGIVVATGLNTAIGHIAQTVTETSQERTPLVKRMERFARWVSLLVVVACAFIFVIGYLHHIPAHEMFFVAVAVAVSAIPEGLPIAMTVALSIGSSRMAKRNVIIQKLSAVEGLGSCSYIGTDKTGTLTVDQQTITQVHLEGGEVFQVTGAGYHGNGEILDSHGKTVNGNPLLEAFVACGVLCNEAELNLQDDQWIYQGDAIDIAFLALAYKYGKPPEFWRKPISRIREIPFESELKYAGLIYFDAAHKRQACLKGAVETILDFCNTNNRTELLQQAEILAGNGYRVMALASGSVTDKLELKNLTFLGLAALIDPLKPEAKQAVQFCREGGIEVVMITGDHPATALSIAREVGIATHAEEVITGQELSYFVSDINTDFSHRIAGKKVFARVSPIQKQMIIAEVRNSKKFVAVTGDGVNDAPALKSANIGVAMGYGSDVAKEAASIIVTDNNFASIAAGIEEGHYTYGNLRKIIYLLISTGTAEILMVFLAILLDLPLPFLAVQLLWLNLVTNGAQDISLAFEKGETYRLKEPPRDAQQGIFDRLMIEQTLVAGITMTVLTFSMWYYFLKVEGYAEAEARNLVLLQMVLIQNFHVFNCRSELASVCSIPFVGNPVALASIVIAQGIHILSMHLPFMQKLLDIQPVSMKEWFELLITASLILVVMEVYKWLNNRKRSASSASQASAQPG